jgi:hypothetical protein
LKRPEKEASSPITAMFFAASTIGHPPRKAKDILDEEEAP